MTKRSIPTDNTKSASTELEAEDWKRVEGVAVLGR